MVVGRAQEGLIDGPADELTDRIVIGQHVLERIRLALDPEAILALDVRADAIRRGLTGADDHLVVVRRGHRTLAVLEAPGEEVVPRGKAPVLVLRVVLVLLHADRALRLGAFPAGRRVVE